MPKEIMGKVRYKEPSREQIKEAFQKTIERWEKIVDNKDYYEISNCALCELFVVRRCKPGACPIAIYTKETCCYGTPFYDWRVDPSIKHALAELNFLRKVYIWWMEGEEFEEEEWGFREGKRLEKKEEWEDVTKQCGVMTAWDDELVICYFPNEDDKRQENDKYEGKQVCIFYITENGLIRTGFDVSEDFKLDDTTKFGRYSRILKKA